jgi:hypothetical protein
MAPNEGIEELLQENVRLARENNRLLRKIRRDELIQTWWTVIFYVLVIGVPFIVYRYYLADYVEQIKNTYLELRGGSDLQGLPAALLSNYLEGRGFSTTSTVE